MWKSLWSKTLKLFVFNVFWGVLTACREWHPFKPKGNESQNISAFNCKLHPTSDKWSVFFLLWFLLCILVSATITLWFPWNVLDLYHNHSLRTQLRDRVHFFFLFFSFSFFFCIQLVVKVCTRLLHSKLNRKKIKVQKEHLLELPNIMKNKTEKYTLPKQMNEQKPTNL